MHETDAGNAGNHSSEEIKMSMAYMAMAPTARRVVQQILAIREGENVCILTDTDCPQSITELLAIESHASGAETVVVVMRARDVGGIEPPRVAAAAIKSCSALIAQTSYALAHTDACREALAGGSRQVHMWGFTEEMMVRGGALADYGEVKKLSIRLAEYLSRGSEAHLTTPGGTDIKVALGDRDAVPLYSMATEPGQFCGFPGGEAAIAPIEGRSNGILVDPYTVEQKEIGFLNEPMKLKVQDGMMTHVEGGAAADKLRAIIQKIGDPARNIAEFAIGTNPACRAGTTIREAKYLYGSVHLALGDNRSLGGKVSTGWHVDLIFLRPTVTVDGHLILQDGLFVL
ncbi:MAG: aminopeptidase [Desulfobacteraceae bacterium]|nr:MAG: aminopeptidase [Desulfobacteraceae bacterium]